MQYLLNFAFVEYKMVQTRIQKVAYMHIKLGSDYSLSELSQFLNNKNVFLTYCRTTLIIFMDYVGKLFKLIVSIQLIKIEIRKK